MITQRNPNVEPYQPQESPDAQAGLMWHFRLALAGITTTSLALAWGLSGNREMPITSYLGLALVLLSLATMLVVAVARHSTPQAANDEGAEPCP